MAILAKYPGLEVTVVVNGQPLQEYDDDDGDYPQPSAVTKYVEAQSGARFGVAFRFKPPFPVSHGVHVRLSIDGKAMMAHSLYASELYQYTLRWDSYGWKRNGVWFKQEFCFSKLDIVEEPSMSRPDITALKRDLGTKGCITLEFWFVRDIKDCTNQSDLNAVQLTAPGRIPEKALKGNALSHQATLSKPQRSFARTSRTFTYVGKEPFATFHFKYRSLASLQALRIVETKETTPVPLEERPEEELSTEELRELVRRMRQRSVTIKPEREATAPIKLERTTGDDYYNDDEVAVVESRPCKRARIDAETIVID